MSSIFAVENVDSFYKHKENVVKHFNRCSGVVPFSDIFCDKW